MIKLWAIKNYVCKQFLDIQDFEQGVANLFGSSAK